MWKRNIDFVVMLQENVLNLLSPIVIGASYSYTEPVGGCGATPCPIADMYHPKAVSVQVCLHTSI